MNFWNSQTKPTWIHHHYRAQHSEKEESKKIGTCTIDPSLLSVNERMRNIPLNLQWFAIRLLHTEVNFFLLLLLFLLLAMIRVSFECWACSAGRLIHIYIYVFVCMYVCVCVHFAYVDRIVFWLVIFFSFIYFAICSVSVCFFCYPYFVIVGLT